MQRDLIENLFAKVKYNPYFSYNLWDLIHFPV